MLSTLGKKKYAAPFVAGILLIIVFLTMFAPMAKMSISSLPFALVNNDAGVSTPAGDIRAGDEFAAKMSASPLPLELTELSTDELEVAEANNDYYGAIIIPEDFSASLAQVQATGEGEASPIIIHIDKARSPMVANQLTQSIPQAFAQAGVATDVQVINAGDSTGSESPFSAMALLQLSVLPLLIASLVTSVLLSRVFGGEAMSQGKRIGIQILSALGISLLIALMIYAGVALLAGVTNPFFSAVGFYWLCSFALMVFFGSLFNVSIPLGGVVALCTMMFGGMLAALPREVLPSFWADFVYPWAPQPKISAGVSEMTFMGEGMWNSGAASMMWFLAIGAIVYAGLYVAKRHR